MKMTNNSILTGLLIVITMFINIATARGAAPEDESRSFYRLVIEADETGGTFTLDSNGAEQVFHYRPGSIVLRENELVISDDLVISDEGLNIDGQLFPFESLRVDEVNIEDKVITVTILNRMQTAAAKRRESSRDRIGVGKKLVIDADSFIRGDVIFFGGDVIVKGEVNRNVVAVFGDVTIESGGIVRANVVAIGGKVYLRDESTLYGEVFSHHGLKKSSRSRYSTTSDAEFESDLFQPDIHYNRVDGLHIGGTVSVSDPDSVLPHLYANLGYAFAAKRGRYDVGIHQRFFEKYSLAVGTHFFRKTASDDEWISPSWEPTVLAIVAAEDPRDYYEEEGGRVYMTFSPGYLNEFGVAYKFTDLGWMDHHPKLWAIFGGAKDFRANFSSVPADERLARRPEFDSKMGELTAWYQVDTRDDEDYPYAGWWGRVEYSTAGDRLKGDITYDRFTVEARRYQPLNYFQSINARVKYGVSGGDVPLFREFYLGGMRTIRGLDHKSLRGEQMLLGNFEYVFVFPWHDLEASLLFDIGAVADRNASILSDGDFKSSIGLGFGFSDGIRVEFSKALDRSDSDVKTWVLLKSSF